MRIVVDLSFIRPDHKNGGTEAHIRNLMRGFIDNHVQNDFIFVIHHDLYAEYKRDFPLLHFLEYRQRGWHVIRMIMFQTFYLPKLLKNLKADVIYFPTFQTGLAGHPGIPVVVNPHDIQYRSCPGNYSFPKRIYYQIFYKKALKKADRIVGISDYVKTTYQRAFGTRITDKMQVLHNPICFPEHKTTDQKPALTGRKPYILSVNSLAKHKNLITLVKAFAIIADRTDCNLVLVGAKWNSGSEMEQYILENGLSDRVLITGYLKDEELAAYYANAKLFVSPSLYEGFGMTPVEAMGMEIPVICSMETSLPEATMGMANYYEPAESADKLADKILEILESDEQKNSPERLKKIAGQVRDAYHLDFIADRYYHFITSNSK